MAACFSAADSGSYRATWTSVANIAVAKLFNILHAEPLQASDSLTRVFVTGQV